MFIRQTYKGFCKIPEGKQLFIKTIFMIFSKVQMCHCAHDFRHNEKDIMERKKCLFYNQY